MQSHAATWDVDELICRPVFADVAYTDKSLFTSERIVNRPILYAFRGPVCVLTL